MAGSFLDTNILLYLASGEQAKADRAEQVVAAGGTVSVQVLNEFANVARGKMKMSWGDTESFLAMLRDLLTLVPVTVETHETGIALARRHGFSVYDSMIVASAMISGCDTLLSEDMQHGMTVGDRLRIVNPFVGS